MQLDKNGDSEGNFSVLAFKPTDVLGGEVTKNFTCPYQMVPVGQFREGEFPVSEFLQLNILKLNAS